MALYRQVPRNNVKQILYTITIPIIFYNEYISYSEVQKSSYTFKLKKLDNNGNYDLIEPTVASTINYDNGGYRQNLVRSQVYLQSADSRTSSITIPGNSWGFSLRNFMKSTDTANTNIGTNKYASNNSNNLYNINLSGPSIELFFDNGRMYYYYFRAFITTYYVDSTYNTRTYETPVNYSFADTVTILSGQTVDKTYDMKKYYIKLGTMTVTSQEL